MLWSVGIYKRMQQGSKPTGTKKGSARNSQRYITSRNIDEKCLNFIKILEKGFCFMNSNEFL